ncbi:class I SAM-dependent methyltransferase [Tepidamorphus sp. 3E244]|uniref:class I SAM-dependent methyltransferase n=1 Tax=Tepidamorphus sp. 3E244 TaxID=3385498 RepID=UPI0038FCCC8F
MATDVADLRDFYTEPLGLVARRRILAQVAGLWGELPGDKVAGLGYATPYIRPYIDSAERVFALMPSRQGVVNWPPHGPSASALVEEYDLPLTDGAVERLLIAHCLEHADFPAEVLKEAGRVLAPGGRLIVIAPNRRGLWARSDNSPFGHGRPFSRSQLSALLRQTGFSPANWREALYVPPYNRFGLLRMSGAFEKLGAITPIMFGGVLIVEAQKQFMSSKPVRARERVSSTVRALAPQTQAAPARRDSF